MAVGGWLGLEEGTAVGRWEGSGVSPTAGATEVGAVLGVTVGPEERT